jgi:hypothetical protein
MDLSNIKFITGDYLKKNKIINEVVSLNFDDYTHRTTDQFMTFDINGYEFTVHYEVLTSVKYYYDPGDYWTPPSEDIEVSEFDIDIKLLTINDYPAELSNEIKNQLKKEINKKL